MSLSRLFRPRPRAREILWCALFSFPFGLAVSVGSTVRVSGMRSSMAHNRLSLSPAVLAKGLALGLLLLPFVLLLLRLSGLYRERAAARTHTPALPKRFPLLAWGLILLGWLPYLLVFCPGGIVGDGACALEDALAPGIIQSNRWMAFVVLVQRLFIRLAYLFAGETLAGLQLGIYLYVIASCVFVSRCLASLCAALPRHGLPRWCAWASVAMFALCGFFASHAMSLWKDGPFSGGIVLLCVWLWDLRLQPRLSARHFIRFTLLFLFLCFWRPNGIVILILSLLLLLLLLRKKFLKIFLCGLCVVVFFFGVTGPVYRALGIRNFTATESISVPLQQMAAVVNGNGKISDKQKQTLFEIIPEETWALYSPTLSDDLKNNLDPEAFKARMPAFLRTWAELLVPNFVIYVRAYLMQTLGYWQPFVHNGNYLDYWFGIQDLAGRGYHRTDLVKKLTGKDLSPYLQRCAGFISSGTMVWLLMLTLALLLAEKKTGRARLVPLVPLFVCWLVIMLSVPIAYSYRYVLMLPMALPLILACPFEPASGHSDAASLNR